MIFSPHYVTYVPQHVVLGKSIRLSFVHKLCSSSCVRQVSVLQIILMFASLHLLPISVRSRKCSHDNAFMQATRSTYDLQPS